MQNASAQIIAFTLLMAIASLIAPEVAFFLKEKTRKKAFLSWIGITVASFMFFVIEFQIEAPEIRHIGIHEVKEELRILYTKLERVLRAGRIAGFRTRIGIYNREYNSWSKILDKLIYELTYFEPDNLLRNGAEALSPIHASLSLSKGQFSAISEDNLKKVLKVIRTDSSDTIGADTLQMAARHVAANPEDSSEKIAAGRSGVVKKTAAAQAELKALYDELLVVIRGATTKRKYTWQKKVEALRSRMEKDLDIAAEIRAARHTC